jgi:hypothetical protein
VLLRNPVTVVAMALERHFIQQAIAVCRPESKHELLQKMRLATATA